MSFFVSGFIRSALIWLVLGAALGMAMTVHPAWVVYRTTHLHMMLLGFVTMFIAGVAYHVLPRFSAAPLWSPELAILHLLLANLGMVCMAFGFCLRVHAVKTGAILLAVGGPISMIGMWVFAWNLWMTLGKANEPAPRALPQRPLPQV